MYRKNKKVFRERSEDGGKSKREREKENVEKDLISKCSRTAAFVLGSSGRAGNDAGWATIYSDFNNNNGNPLATHQPENIHFI